MTVDVLGLEVATSGVLRKRGAAKSKERVDIADGMFRASAASERCQGDFHKSGRAVSTRKVDRCACSTLPSLPPPFQYPDSKEWIGVFADANAKISIFRNEVGILTRKVHASDGAGALASGAYKVKRRVYERWRRQGGGGESERIVAVQQRSADHARLRARQEFGKEKGEALATEGDEGRVTVRVGTQPRTDSDGTERQADRYGMELQIQWK
ncbi:hypothetical protein FB451DRAFT_1185734 [Mycena latifolia]|nr:hypothetical protein FB451DRAFT_1185734 [Mycena latifolia]